ncbi:hypothetical protein KJS94_14425 [Flavihumibacter rivuli]|uniref:hypothetical protein n=1 Tax=Flavihumibacter rivuli TaxID=2838156 RepID=UPI001BDDF749|nr:hypothetical protein [Flavihumibacter rivuli]ULQ55842.1 hypothetical protein KJS94_14425 [Flavihumibacter rivuli]
MEKILLTILTAFSISICSGQARLPLFKDTYSRKGKPKIAMGIEMRERVVQYLGPFKDTITIEPIPDKSVAIGDNKVLIDDTVRNKYAYYTNGKLKISIDPLTHVTLEEYEWWSKKPEYKYYKANPIIIHNETDSTTIVGYGYTIPIVLEALDIDKVWKPVEIRYIYDCGIGLEYILLKPKDIMCVLAPVYGGDFKTKLRYKLGNSLSSEFVGQISRRQFDFKGKYK